MQGMKCDICGKTLAGAEDVGTIINYHGESVCLCEDCEAARSTIFSGNADIDEVTSTIGYFRKLLESGKPTPVGGLFIKDCVLNEKISNEDVPEEMEGRIDVDSVNNGGTKSSFASFLRVLAWIAWIGGLILSVTGANVTTVGYYGSYKEFSFTAFLTLSIPYFIYGVILMGMATMAEQVADTNRKVSKILTELEKH